MKKVLLLVMVLCLGLLVIPTQAAVYYELWDLVPPGNGLVDIDWLTVPAPDGQLDALDELVGPFGTLNNFKVGETDDWADTYTYRQIAILNIATAGGYNFWCNSDDGSLIFIDGVLLANFDGWHGPEDVVEGVDPGYGKTLTEVDELAVEHAVPTALSAGPHLIEVLMFEDGGGDMLEVRYAMSTDENVADFIADADLSLPVVPVTPASWEIDVPLSGATLSWTNPLEAAQFNVYFGTDPNDIDTFAMLTVDVTSTSIDGLAGGDLVNDTRYFVRIDTIAEPNNVLGAFFAFDSMRMAPIITGDPVSAVVGDGGCLAVFSVSATSGINGDGGDLSYQWFNDDVALTGEIGDTLVTDIAGSYYCVVSNAWGEAASAAASLSIIGAGSPISLDGLLGYWPFDVDGSDASGNGLDTVLSGNARIVSEGKFKGALDCDGSDGFADTGALPSALGLTGNATRSVSCWVYTRGFGNGGIYDMGNRQPHEDFSLRTLDGTPDRWRIQYWGGDYDFTYSTSDKWVHFVHVFDGAATRIYADGELFINWDDRDPAALNTGDDMTFGIGVYGRVSSIFDGMIDDISLWNRALTAEEAAALYSVGQTGGTLAGPDWAPINPQYSPELNAKEWFDPNFDLTLSWEKAALGPCGAGVTYDVIWTTDEAVAMDPNAVPYATVADTMVTIPASDLNYEDEIYVRVDVNYNGYSGLGNVWFVKAIKLIPDIVIKPQDSGLVLQGSTASFSVETDSDTPVSYEWFMEVADGADVSKGAGVTEGNVNTLTLVGVGIPDDGMYYCIATNSSGPIQTRSVRLEIGQLIGHWTMDEMVDSVDAEDAPIKIVTDSSPFGRDGIVMGDPNLPIVVAGKIGNAIEFNPGTETEQWVDCLLLASELEIGGSHAKSVSAWAYAKEMNDGGIWDIGQYSDNMDFSLRTENESHGDHGWRLQFWGGGDYNFNSNEPWNLYKSPESWNSARPDPVAFPSLDAWVHFVLTYGDGVAKVFANGRLIGLSNVTLNTADSVGFRIGKWNTAEFKGIIDDVRLYNYALTAAEAAQLYLEVEGGSACPEDPTYDFNGDCETTLVDFAMFLESWMECNLIQCY